MVPATNLRMKSKDYEWYDCHLKIAKCSTDHLQLPGGTDTAASFAFEKEDHTLGNALRYMIMKK